MVNESLIENTRKLLNAGLSNSKEKKSIIEC